MVVNVARLKQLLDEADPDGNADVWVLGPGGTWEAALDLLDTGTSSAGPPPGKGIGITYEGA
jgi:hypothetical protein